MNQDIGTIEFNTPLLCIGVAFLILFLLAYFYALIDARKRKQRFLEQYPLIYRVISVPSADQFTLKAGGASIEIGDYAWEAESVYQDGLIYLHGLNPHWRVVWYAGFRPDQVEIIGTKPKSQYYIFPYWVDERKVPQCPFPVKTYGMNRGSHLGYPVEIQHYRRSKDDWVQGLKVPKHN